MKHRIVLSTALAAVILILASCAPSQRSENLPRGIHVGFWAVTTPGQDHYSGGVAFIDDDHYVDGDGYFGTYSLTDDDDTVFLQSPYDSYYLTMSETKTRDEIVVEDDSGQSYTLKLVIPNSSWGDFEEDILGAWTVYYELGGIGTQDQTLDTLTFDEDQQVTYQSGYFEDERQSFNYLVDEDKLTFTYEGDSETYSIYSLGDMIVLYSDENSFPLILVREGYEFPE